MTKTMTMQGTSLSAQLQERARRMVEEAERLQAAAAYQESAGVRYQAMLWYAEAWRMGEEQQAWTPTLTHERAEACQACGDALARIGSHAEAATVFQEAADIYGLLSGTQAIENARRCARKALGCVTALNAHPQDRLYLLIARYERQQRQLALQAGTLAEQVACCLHIAQILLRRDRWQEAYLRFQEALSLSRQADHAGAGTEAVMLAQAECHHRLGTLLADVLVDEPDHARQALRHYEQAVALYHVYEPKTHGEQENAVCVLSALLALERRLAQYQPEPKE